jgi:hypothetical protein
VRLAISPFLSSFNSELKEERSKAEKLYGEAMSEVRISLQSRRIS